MSTTLKVLTLCIFTTYYAFGQSDCTPIPEVDFPGGRVVMSNDGNVHDDDDIVAVAYAAGLWWAAGLQDKVVQFEYNNHVCDTGANESDGVGAGSGDDSSNMRTTASGAIENFGYSSSIFYDYERQGSASTAKMAAEIEKSTASDPLWILAGGPMETVWRGLEAANGGFDHVTIISHSKWNESHTHCSDAHDWDDLKNKYQGKGVYFVENCDSGGCSSSNKLNDQNGGFNSSKSNWDWMRNSDKQYNRWIYSRNPWSSKFDPSDAGMSYFLITGGPFNGGDKTPDHNDARKLMENPCQGNTTPDKNQGPNLRFDSPSPSNGASFKVGDEVSVKAIASDSDGSITEVSLYINDDFIRNETEVPYLWGDSDAELKNLKKGEYRLKLVAKDDDGATNTETLDFSVTEDDNDKAPKPESNLPVISIESPQDNQTVATGDNVSIDVSAADDGNVVKYQIFVNGALVDTDGSSFTPHVINNIDKGSYTIRVEATGEDGGKTIKSIGIKAESDPRVDNNSPEEDDDEVEVENPTTESPVFEIVSPADGANFGPGETISVDLAATNDSDIVEYQIFVDDQLVDTDPANFTPYLITNAQIGTYTIRAEATGGNGAKTVKTVVVGVGNKSGNDGPISLSVSPADGAYFEQGTNVSVDVSASSDDGDIVQTLIFVNGSLVDTDPAYFTPYTIANVQAGNYDVKVEVTDNEGREKASHLSFDVGHRSVGLVARINADSAKLPNDGYLSLRIAPNPVRGSQMNVFQKRSSDLRITNIYGTLVKQIDNANEVAKIEVSGLAPGMYILESDTESAKFIIPE